MDAAEPCPLCESTRTVRLPRAHGREYFGCETCGLAYLSPALRLDPDTERARYETHENDPKDPRYRAFLDRLCVPLLSRLRTGAEGLDYGSGPGPTLSVMCQERGFPMQIYDPFFAPDPQALQRRYDFVTCTETVEHFHSPRAEMERLDALVLPGGWIGIMTQMLGTDRDFSTWYYLRDPTHVCFWRRETFVWVGGWLGWEARFPVPNVVLFQKPSG